MKTIEQYISHLWHKYLQSNHKDILLRYLHSLAVLKEAEVLVKRFSLPVDLEKVRIAAVLHDYAKFESEERFRELAQKYKVASAIMKMSPKIWHALLGPYVITEDLLITDTDILDAVRWHTTGSINMNLTAEVIFLADFIDASRIEGYFDEVKTVAQTDFKKAISLKIKWKMIELNDYSEKQINLYNKYAEVKWKF